MFSRDAAYLAVHFRMAYNLLKERQSTAQIVRSEINSKSLAKQLLRCAQDRPSQGCSQCFVMDTTSGRKDYPYDE